MIPKAKTMLQVLRPGIFIFFHIQGPVSNQDRMTSMRLTAQEVIPAIREDANEIGLVDPYERTPRSLIVDREPLAALGLA